MTSRDRVLAAFERRKADRPATDLGCTAEVWDALKLHFGVETVNDVLDAMDIDMRWVDLPFIGPEERSVGTLCGEGTDFWGNKMAKAVNKYNTYYEIVYHPLANAETVEDIENHNWPSLDWWDYSAIPKQIEEINKKDERAIMFFAGGAFETPWYMRGFENFLVDLCENPEIVEAICSHVEKYYRERALKVIDVARGKIDIIGSGGDIGGQNGMIISPDIWRQRIKPFTGKLISTFKEMGLKTFYHSCGSLVPVINDLIEVGLDVLEPIQVTAAGMKPEELFPSFGKRLSFHGAIDEVGLLPHATAEEVYGETTRIIDILGQNGGFIVTPSHQVQGDTPVENIIAIYDAVKNYKYK
ncbi:MAG: hypothetical protein FIA99_14440 [Ruminiclostridium sp.]|nr:hypothetical protein [Ruminiclostridium sp.]